MNLKLANPAVRLPAAFDVDIDPLQPVGLDRGQPLRQVWRRWSAGGEPIESMTDRSNADNVSKTSSWAACADVTKFEKRAV